MNLFILVGQIDNDTFHKLCRLMEDDAPSENGALLIASTPGGDPHAAYKIARRLQEHYGWFDLYPAGMCKSAGTLLACGAREIQVDWRSELGPIDIQRVDRLRKTRTSEINILTAMNALAQQSRAWVIESCDAFATSTSLSYHDAMEHAVAHVAELLQPMIANIHPSGYGEAMRSMKLTRFYAERLSEAGQNISNENIQLLVEGFPSHEFVIDSTEIKKLFRKVRDVEPELRRVLGSTIDALKVLFHRPAEIARPPRNQDAPEPHATDGHTAAESHHDDLGESHEDQSIPGHSEVGPEPTSGSHSSDPVGAEGASGSSAPARNVGKHVHDRRRGLPPDEPEAAGD